MTSWLLYSGYDFKETRALAINISLNSLGEKVLISAPPMDVVILVLLIIHICISVVAVKAGSGQKWWIFVVMLSSLVLIACSSWGMLVGGKPLVLLAGYFGGMAILPLISTAKKRASRKE
ncbi:MAG: hypothetical protein ACRDAX_06395 [Propionibacteriaceae bacterium]